MCKGFSITYETVTPESAEHGEAEDAGFYLQELTFSEAWSYLRNLGAIGCHCEADSYPIRNPSWFTFYQVDENYATGEVTSYALHVPSQVTESSRMRIARALGCYGLTSRKMIGA
jgi:hypothetical protein